MIRRTTIQKELILDAVTNFHNHATTDEIHRQVQAAHPHISIRTVQMD